MALYAAAAMPVYAQSTGAGVVKLPRDIEFKGPLTGPPQSVVVYGELLLFLFAPT